MSKVFVAALDDGLVVRNPVQAKSVALPKVPERKARPWTLAQVQAMAGALPERFAVLPCRRATDQFFRQSARDVHAAGAV